MTIKITKQTKGYTPGLKITDYTVVRKERRLPLKGELLVSKGDRVEPETIVAKGKLPGDPLTINVAYQLNIDPEDVPLFMKKQLGESVKKGDVLAEVKSLFGLFKNTLKSPTDGTVEMISPITGQVTLREPPMLIELNAYVKGNVVDIIFDEGVVIETKGALIQGIFGVGGEQHGIVEIVVSNECEALTCEHIVENHKGKIIIGGSSVTKEALRKAQQVGVKGIVTGGIIDKELMDFLGYEIGVAITGRENIGLSIIITEGFGQINMAKRTFELLKAMEGMNVSINGATQIRAGVMRPEIIAPGFNSIEKKVNSTSEKSVGLQEGAHVRIIREPFFGEIAKIENLPTELEIIETEAKVRVLNVTLLASGNQIAVPRANVETLEE